MAKKRSALERVRSNPKNVKVKDLQDLLVDFGFELRGISGDHHVYKKAGYRPVPIPIGQNPVAYFIVKEILKLVEAMEEKESAPD